MQRLNVNSGIKCLRMNCKIILLFLLLPLFCVSQTDSTQEQRWNFHFQQTVVMQGKPAISAKYSGPNSLLTSREMETSLTSTLFIGLRLWKNAAFYFNPELAGGAGISKALGMGGFANGETFRVGDPKPVAYIARGYVRQLFKLGNETEMSTDGLNQLQIREPQSYVSIVVGKFGIADFFDINKYSHDPRRQFLNWALMNNGAWDYPANTRGYTWGGILELAKPSWTLRASVALVPETANGPYMDLDITNAHSLTIELEKKYTLHSHPGTIRVLAFSTNAHMGNYQAAIDISAPLRGSTPDITATRTSGNTKYGFGINGDQDLTDDLGLFFRLGWNDGTNETWAYTEIDQTASVGLVLKGTAWKRSKDLIGIAVVANGISADHRAYLKAGGSGFMLGDGGLDYANELISEVYYNISFEKYHFWLAPDHQFVLNPGYNSARGPVNIFAGRVHIEF